MSSARVVSSKPAPRPASNPCPICQTPAGCSHLVATIDLLGAIPIAGAFTRIEPVVVSALDKAIHRLIRHRARRAELGVVVPVALSELAREVHASGAAGQPRVSVRDCKAILQRYIMRRLKDCPSYRQGHVESPPPPPRPQPTPNRDKFAYLFEADPEPTRFAIWHEDPATLVGELQQAILHDAALLVDPSSLRLNKVKVGLAMGLPFDGEPAEWPPIPCSRRPSASARLLTEESGSNLYDSWSYAFFLCSNKRRTHWILWVRYDDPYECRKRQQIVAWCRAKGISQHNAGLLLLRAWHHQEKELFGESQRSSIDPGLLTEADVASIYYEVWPDWMNPPWRQE